MATWAQLLEHFGQLTTDAQRSAWFSNTLISALNDVSNLRGGRNVLLYGSAFLQKPQLPSVHVMITFEEINGLMSSLHGMQWDRGLTLILHTPGGMTNATESIVEYLRSKFSDIEVIIPTFAMSAGTMISLAADQIWMANHSQLGPIDPQMVGNGRSMPARAVVQQFQQARSEVMDNVASAHVWAPILGTIGPALLKEAENVIAYSEDIVAGWLGRYMFREEEDPSSEGKRVARQFNEAGTMNDHGHRIGRDEAQGWGVKAHALESDQALQEAVLTAYHAMTMLFEHAAGTKLMITSSGNTWMKNFETAEQQMARLQQQALQDAAAQPGQT